MTAKDNKVIRFQSKHQVNIGLVVFTLIIIYLIYNLFSYLASYNIAEYEVQEGVIASNSLYRGLVLRDETVVYADQDGDINYYVKNGSKVSANDVIYSIDTEGSIAAKINAAAGTSETLDSDELTDILEEIDKFSNSYSSENYQTVSSFKADLASELNQSLTNRALSTLSPDITVASGMNTFYQEIAGDSGVVTYYVDGMESVTSDDYLADDLISTNYSRTNLEDNTSVKAGDAVYKLVNNEDWNIIIAISSDKAEYYKKHTSLKVHFTKDDTTIPATCQVDRKEGNYYLNLSLKSGMIRYIGDRYEEIELVTGDNQGLKIPVSAVVQKDLFRIPSDYFTGSTTLQLKVRTGTGAGDVKLVTPTIYYYEKGSGEKSGYYYISDDAVSQGDILVKDDDNTEYYTVGGKGKKPETAENTETTDNSSAAGDTESTESVEETYDIVTFDGVYELNKGYAIFRCISIDESTRDNDDYYIVSEGTNRGISLYDHIALDGSKVTDGQTVIR